MVSSSQHLAAGHTGEAVEVVDVVSGPHHQLVGGDTEVAAGASLHREPPTNIGREDGLDVNNVMR